MVLCRFGAKRFSFPCRKSRIGIFQGETVPGCSRSAVLKRRGEGQRRSRSNGTGRGETVIEYGQSFSEVREEMTTAVGTAASSAVS